MTQHPSLLIVIADGAHARFVRPAKAAHGRPAALRTERAVDSPVAHQRSSDLGSDHPGASFHSQSTAHHALAPRHDPHALAEAEFARTVAAQINAAFAGQDFTHVLLVAPARTLGIIRDELRGDVAAAVVGTLEKDLVKTPDHDLPDHLRQWLVPPFLA